MAQLVYRSPKSGRRIIKNLSVEDRIIQKHVALGLSLKEARNQLKWLQCKIETRLLTRQTQFA
jgi:hypothetical protein